SVFHEVQNICQIQPPDRTMVTYDNKTSLKSLYEEDIIQADSSYFSVFNHGFISGDAKTCLNGLHNLVITESAAKKYFPSTDPLGEFLTVDDVSWKVTAVIEDVPENSHLKFDMLLSVLPA